MRVMCINDKWIPHPQVKDNPTPVFGNDYFVTEIYETFFGSAYTLDGFCPDQVFLANHFAILPDQPAEVIEEEELATA